MGQNDLCKENSSSAGDKIKTGDYKEPDYIEPNSESYGAKLHDEL